VSESAPLRAAVSNPTISRAGLEQMLKAGLSKEKLDKITNNFIQLLAKNRRVDLIGKVTASFNAYLDEHRNVAVAEVTVAKKMSAAQEKALAKELKAATGKDVRLQVRVDEGILGGMIVKVGSLMLDGSLSGRLEGLKRVSKQAVTTL
jgi:F-type H+-transporting ATPase subunit delta